MQRLLVVAALVAVAFSGCLSNEVPAKPADSLPTVGDVLNVTVDAVATFEKSVVTAAVDFTGDLYEPTLEVSDSGVIYITGHTILVDTTGAPVFMSRDDGQTWEQLPWFQTLTMPEPVQGATPPVTDEIFLVAGDDGWLYGADITLASFPVNAWSGDGEAHAYYNPNAYDESQVALQATPECQPVAAKDRPWAAYANGTLLLVNNPASGPAQVGVMSVPPALPAGVGPAEVQWNLCAGPAPSADEELPVVSIPGVPDIRGDGLFAVPQRSSNSMTSPATLHLVLGNAADVMDTRVVDLFEFTTAGEITSVYGHAVFDGQGDLLVGITNNTSRITVNDNQVSRLLVGDDVEALEGQFILAASTDGGESFQQRTFTTGTGPVRHFYMDANEQGPGSLVVWAVDGETDGGYDWYTGHFQVGADGAPVLENVVLAIDEGPRPSAHVTGAGVGPDGRAYLAMYESVAPGGTPLSVYVQQDGPTLPVAAPAVDVDLA